jgi:hypothetical protein
MSFTLFILCLLTNILCILGNSKQHSTYKINLMKYETEQMIFSYPQDEWFLYHSDLSRYVSNCTEDGGVWCLTSLSTIWQFISWWSVLLVEETRVPRENHWPATNHWQTFITYCCIEYTLHEWNSNSQH